MVQAKVNWYSDGKGFGFLRTLEDPGRDVFVHYSAILCEGFKTLKEGALVECEIVDGPKGPMAWHVRELTDVQVGASLFERAFQ